MESACSCCVDWVSLIVLQQGFSIILRVQLQTLSALFIVLLMGAMAFCASWQLPKFLFQGSDSEYSRM